MERRLHKSGKRKVVASSLVSAEPEEVTAHRAVKDLKVTRRNRPTSLFAEFYYATSGHV